MMLSTFLFSAMAIAGMTVLWRSWLRDHSSWTIALGRIPFRLGKSLTCGTCFTFWLTLVILLLVRPALPEFQSNIFASNEAISHIVSLFLQWMALSWAALIGRFTYAALEEVVYFFVHHIREGHVHPHKESR